MTNKYESFAGTIEHAVVQVGATSGDQTIIAAPGASKYLWITGYRLVVTGAVGLQWRDTAAATHSGTMALAAKGAVGEPPSPYPVFKLAANKGLVLNLDAAQVVGGYVKYRTIE